ncbi:family 16 glycosylhydrolase [Neotamlana laminarinivorans]|uniref:Family 16 glycosylhydrolase n=1 Tax=Neotamlana laminarinivorans TaxID=2883124 RepID=A0A9X1HZ62_9FLAO|nr:family 16 glycosylhydrolase [Tamlana laminarinivorans]MCB4798276.1 family 16 glycosylhydrolase [Tamlana laminarinivorans]UYI35443.1 laminarinase [Tamlana laminarinivorans]
MKNLKYIIGILLLALISFSCEEENYELGDIVAPSNIEVSYTIQGQDTSDPELEYGDGTGYVDFVVTADNAISYKINYGDGTSEVVPTGEVTKRYSLPDANTYTVIVTAIGVTGTSSTMSLDITVYSSFSDVEVVEFLAGDNAGDSKTWYWAANQAAHIGLGPVEDDYGNGEFAWPAWWNAIGPWDEEKYCMYTNEFVFTRLDEDGTMTFEQSVGPAFVPGTYAAKIGIDGDVCHDETVVTSMFGVKNVSFAPSSSKAALEGSYNDEPYRGTEFTIADDGFMGWYVGASSYDIISVTDEELIVRIIENGNDYTWYQVFTSTKPVEGVIDADYEFETLVWSDEFDTDGAPNPDNWTYDLGDGGWGNGESQTYTSDADNVIVDGGYLKITAKSDGNGGYTSARLKSQGLQSFGYARVEVSAKLPSAQGTWPAIWMLGDSFSTVGWPHCGEMDIMEQTGADKDRVLGTVHWFDDGTNANASYGESTDITNASSEFHLYTIEYTESAIKIYLDDVQYYELTNNSSLPFNDPFFIILNIAMGGTLGGTIDSGFTEDTMEIDYVRVYQ